MSKSKGKPQDFALMIHEREGLTQLVCLPQLVDEGDRVNDFGHGPKPLLHVAQKIR